ncbi:hypothetical protein PFISCL1PPCAC_26316, partial [Pristionchus fissidentatus]
LHRAAATAGQGCGDAERQQIRDILKQDIFLRHLNAGTINNSLTECRNFHRHICPKGGLSDQASTKGLFEEMLAIEKTCTEYDVYSKIESDFAYAKQFDHFTLHKYECSISDSSGYAQVRSSVDLRIHFSPQNEARRVFPKCLVQTILDSPN